MSSKVLFINASQNKDGNTVKMGKDLLNGTSYDQINLIDYRIGFLGQKLKDDQFKEVTDLVKQADTIVIGTPVYWHSMSGALKTLIDRASEDTSSNPFKGKKLYFFMQGAAPTELSKESTVYIIQRFANQLGMELKGTATDSNQLQKLKTTLENDK
ncbi:flavodoxin family protein [Streptococcus macacae]|nr:NAD(P)H dehydrogenase (quinone) [Streptococcus macacae NCTC 11558]